MGLLFISKFVPLIRNRYKIYRGYIYIDNSRGLFAANDTFEFSNSFNKGSLLRNTTE